MHFWGREGGFSISCVATRTRKVLGACDRNIPKLPTQIPFHTGAPLRIGGGNNCEKSSKLVGGKAFKKERWMHRILKTQTIPSHVRLPAGGKDAKRSQVVELFFFVIYERPRFRI